MTDKMWSRQKFLFHKGKVDRKVVRRGGKPNSFTYGEDQIVWALFARNAVYSVVI